MKASAQYTFTDVSTSAISTLISDSPHPIFILDEDRETVISSNQTASAEESYELKGISVNRILFNYRSNDPQAPVYYRDKWYNVSEKPFVFHHSEYTKVTLTHLPNHLSDETLKTTQDLIAILLHRFRSPLTAIQGYTDIMSLAVNEESEKQQNYIEKINKGTENITDILEEFESLLIEKEEDQKHVFKVSSMLNDLISARSNASVKDRIRFRAPENASIIGSRDKILRVLSLLVDNALEHSKTPASPVMITVRNPHMIEVSNRGRAIDKDKADDIFKPFITSRSDKTGIGLTLAQLLANNIGASIHLKSAEEDNISFVLNLPPRYMTVLNS